MDALIHLGPSWASDTNKLKTLFNLWREIFQRQEFNPKTSSEAISLIYVRLAAYHSLLTFVKVFEKQIPNHPELQSPIAKRLGSALSFDNHINNCVNEKKNK